MANDIKNLIDSIIDDTNNSYPKASEARDGEAIVKFDKGEFREKLSMQVLKDLICAMMHDETKDLDGMIDASIMRHIRDNYQGSCYGYLVGSRNTLNSPVLNDIIQEIDDKTEEVAETVCRTKDKCVAEGVDVQVVLKNVENYDELREKLKEEVSKKVVEDVSKVITTSNDAPVFDDIDEKIEVKDTNEKTNDVDNSEPMPLDDPTNESVILRVCGAIVTESAMAGNRISTEQGINQAIVEYCITEMDKLFKQIPKIGMYDRYPL